MFSMSSFIFGSSLISGAFGWVSAVGLAKKLRVAERDNALLKKRNKKLAKNNKQLRKDFYELGDLAAKALDDMSNKNRIKKPNFIEIVIDSDTVESIEQLSDSITTQIDKQIADSDKIDFTNGISVEIKFVKGDQFLANMCVCAHITDEVPEKEIFDAVFKTFGVSDLSDIINTNDNKEDDNQSNTDNKNDFDDENFDVLNLNKDVFDKNINIINKDVFDKNVNVIDEDESLI